MIPYSKQSILESDISAVSEVLSSDWITQGPKVPEFESALEETLGVKYALGCSSGTAALQLAYAAIGVGPKSVGIVPSVTFAATANAFRNLGATVYFCDVNQNDGIIDLQSLKETLEQVRESSEYDKGVISPVSLAGKTAPLEEVYKLAQKYEFHVVEDASHSPGAYYDDHSGSKTKSANCKWTDAATLSFHPVKHICCGEGGAVLTNSKDIYSKAELLRSHGITRETNKNEDMPWYYEQIELGWNFRLTDIQASLGIEQLKRLNESILRRYNIAKRYDQAFRSPKFANHLHTPEITEGHALHLYVIRFKEKGVRNKAYHFLKQHDILSQVHYIPLYRHPYHSGNYTPSDFPGAEAYFDGCLSIPIHPTLTEAEQETVIEVLSNFVQKN